MCEGLEGESKVRQLNLRGAPNLSSAQATRRSYFLGKGTKGQAKGKVQAKGAKGP